MKPQHRPLDVPPQSYSWRGHRIAYYVDGSGPPLLLLHSINAAASAFEMRAPFSGLRGTHRVYALEFLGYGHSDRPAQVYTAEDYAALITDFAHDIISAPVPIIASSLSAAYTVKAAARCPDRFGALVLACPTGIERLVIPRQPGTAYNILRGPAGDLAFAGLSSRSSIALFLKSQSYYDAAKVDDATLDGFYFAAQQPGAKYAPICFLTGVLNCDIRADFGQLQQPILIVWGRQARTTPLEDAKAFLKRNPRARLEVIDHATLSVQDEQPETFNRLAADFLAQAQLVTSS